MKLNKIIEAKRKQMERAKKMETAKNVAVGTAIGTAIGAAAGLLFAPKSGKETREDIALKSKEVAGNLKTTVNEQLENTKEWTEKIKTEAKHTFEDFKDKKKTVSEETMEIASDIVEDVGEGLASVGEILKETQEEIKEDLEK